MAQPRKPLDEQSGKRTQEQDRREKERAESATPITIADSSDSKIQKDELWILCLRVAAGSRGPWGVSVACQAEEKGRDEGGEKT